MKKIVTTILILVSCTVCVLAKPAKPGFFRFTQPDGSTILIQRHGDEWAHWTTNESGQVVRMDDDGFYRVVEGTTPEMAAQAASIRRKARKQLISTPSQAPVAVGQKKFLVVLAEFSDKSFTVANPQQAFSDMLNEKGYSDNGATGSARDYYYENAHGIFEPIFDVFGPVKLSQTVSYYGKNDSSGNDENAHLAIRDACKALDSTVDFSQYDLDGDGEVDLVYLVYAGKGEADGGASNTIWPHQWFLYSGGGVSLNLDGKRIDRYACGSELNGSGTIDGLGTICHEFGHAMGLPDFYDTDYDTNGQARTLLDFSLMDAGSYNNNGWTPPYLNMEERIMIGWLSEDDVLEFPRNGSYTLESVQNNVGYKIPTEKEGEYILLECRNDEGWDSALPAFGLIAYHVDKSSRIISIGSGVTSSAYDLWANWDYYNAINENGNHPCFYVIASASPYSCSYGMQYYSSYGMYAYTKPYTDLPFPGGKNVTSYTPRSWDGTDTQIKLSSIAYADGKVGFTVSGIVSPSVDYHTIANPGKGIYAAGSSFNLTLVEAEDRPVQSVSWSFDGQEVSASSVTLSAGKHLVEAKVSLADGRTDFVTLELEAK